MILFAFRGIVPRRTVSIGKTSLKWLPLFGQIYWLAGNVLIDRGNAAKAKAAMLRTTDVMQRQDTSIWVFPEGTRHLGRGLLPFNKGVFQMAVSAEVLIVPLRCSTYKTGTQLHRWHAGTVKILALPAILTAGLTLEDLPDLMARCHRQMQSCIAQLDAALTP